MIRECEKCETTLAVENENNYDCWKCKKEQEDKINGTNGCDESFSKEE